MLTGGCQALTASQQGEWVDSSSLSFISWTRELSRASLSVRVTTMRIHLSCPDVLAERPLSTAALRHTHPHTGSAWILQSLSGINCLMVSSWLGAEAMLISSGFQELCSICHTFPYSQLLPEPTRLKRHNDCPPLPCLYQKVYFLIEEHSGPE